MARSSSLPHRTVVQSAALLLAADGVANEAIARECAARPDTVRRWRSKFEAGGVDAVGSIAPGRGRKPEIAQDVIDAIIEDTLHTVPDDGATAWSTRTMAERHGVGKDTVARVWKARQLRPWRIDTFKLSNDPAFESKLVDVVGLYLDPPERAAVFSFDEKTQCQALDRTQPSLPLKAGRGRTMTHDYKRNGTIDLFAALNVGTGEVLHQTRQRRAGLLQMDRSPRALRPRGARRVGQPLRALGATGRRMAGPPETPTLAPALHPDQLVMAEPRRGLVRAAHQPPPPQRQLQLRRRPHRRHRDLGLTLERR